MDRAQASGAVVEVGQAAMDRAEYVGDVAARSDPAAYGCDYVFPSPITGRPSPSLGFPWRRIRARAGLQDLRLHDLRHSFASFLINEGVSLYVVQALLGHANARTTQRYAHLASDTLTDATEIVDGIVAAQPRMVTPPAAARGVHVPSW